MNIQCFWAWSICVPQSNICLYRKARLFYSSKIHLVARTGWLKSFRWANARCTAYGNILLRKRWLDFLLRCAVGQENIFAPKFRSASEKAFGEHFCSVGWLIVHMDSHLWFFVKAWSFHKCTCSFYDLSFVSTCQMQCLAVASPCTVCSLGLGPTWLKQFLPRQRHGDGLVFMSWKYKREWLGVTRRGPWPAWNNQSCC